MKYIKNSFKVFLNFHIMISFLCEDIFSNVYVFFTSEIKINNIYIFINS